MFSAADVLGIAWSVWINLQSLQVHILCIPMDLVFFTLPSEIIYDKTLIIVGRFSALNATVYADVNAALFAYDVTAFCVDRCVVVNIPYVHYVENTISTAKT